MKCWTLIVVCLLTGSFLAGAQTNEVKVSEPISVELAKKAISAIEQDPLGEISKAAVAVLLQFAEESEDVVVTIDDSIMPLLRAAQEHEYGKVLFAAFIAGNLRPQLESGISQDQGASGKAQAVATYAYLKERKHVAPLPILEEWTKEVEAAEQATDSMQDRLEAGRQKLNGGSPMKAIADYFDPVIQHFDELYGNSGQTIYSCDSLEISLIYSQLTMKADKDCTVLPGTWAEAYFLKAYALVEMNELDQAKASLKKAVTLSPYNPKYWSELGHVFQTEKNWNKCMTAFEKAEEAAAYYEGDEKTNHLTCAWRGIGYVLVELGKLDEAEAKYKQCLELDPDDQKAKAELEYIEDLRNKN